MRRSRVVESVSVRTGRGTMHRGYQPSGCGRRRKIDSQRERSSADRDPLYVQRIYELQSRSLFRKSNDGGGRCVNSAEFVLLTKLPTFAATDGN